MVFNGAEGGEAVANSGRSRSFKKEDYGDGPVSKGCGHGRAHHEPTRLVWPCVLLLISTGEALPSTGRRGATRLAKGQI